MSRRWQTEADMGDGIRVVSESEIVTSLMQELTWVRGQLNAAICEADHWKRLVEERREFDQTLSDLREGLL